MVEDITDFVERLLERYGFWRVVVGPYTFVMVLAGIGLVQNRGAAAVTAAAFLIFASFVLVTLLGLRVRILRQKLNSQRRTLEWCFKRLFETRAQAYILEEYEGTTFIRKGGDTTTELFVTVRAGRGGLSYYRLTVYKVAGPPPNSGVRNQVEVEARSFNLQRELGAGYDVFPSWQTDRRYVIYIPLPQPIAQGETLRLWVRWSWPGYTKEVVDGSETDRFEWYAERAIQNLKSKVVFEASCRLRQALAVTEFGPASDLAVRQEMRDSTVSIDIQCREVPTGATVGFRVDNPATRRRPRN